jgi:hypothetical protein
MLVYKTMLRLGSYMNFAIALAHIAMFFAITQLAAVLGMPAWLGRMLAEGWLGWTKLFLMVAGVAVFVSLLGLYGLSGAGRIRRLPLLRTGLLCTGSIFLLHGLFDDGFGLVWCIGALATLVAKRDPRLFLGLIPLTTLTIGLLYLFGTIGLWSALAPDKGTRPARRLTL